MTTVVLDTNALLVPVECGVRVFEQLDRLVDGPVPVVPEPVREELAGLSDGGGETATAASVGLDLADRAEHRSTAADYADDAVLEVAADETGYAVTNDRPLRDRLHGRGVPVICLRGETELVVTQP